MSNTSYDRAVSRVKRIRGFYTHLLIYVLINVTVTALNLVLNHDISNSKALFRALTHFSIYSNWLFWGIVLLLHGLRTFEIFPFKDRQWEKRKIQEFMEEEENEDLIVRNRWE